MNVNPHSQNADANVPQSLTDTDAFPNESLRARWGDRMFYVVSAVLHIAVAIGLSYSFARSTAPAKTQAAAVTPPPQKAAAPRGGDRCWPCQVLRSEYRDADRSVATTAPALSVTVRKHNRFSVEIEE